MTVASGRLERRQASPRRPRTRGSSLVYVIPALAVYGAFILFPLGKSIFYSLHDWNGVGPRTWVGTDNYSDAFGTPLLRSSIFNALKLLVFFSVIPVSLGLLLAAVIARRAGRHMAAYRLVFFVPYVLPMVATGIIWRWMYNRRGVVNQGLELVGLDRFARAWLGDFDFALIAVGLIGSWTLCGFCMMLFIAGAQRIDLSLYDAARIDGAGAYWQFRAVTLPGLRREISVALVVTAIAALGTFDVVYVTTDGGPVNATVLPSLLVYRLAFREQKVGQAAALSMILTVLIVVMVGIVRRMSRERT